jgi:hypothetical protein
VKTSEGKLETSVHKVETAGKVEIFLCEVKASYGKVETSVGKVGTSKGNWSVLRVNGAF